MCMTVPRWTGCWPRPRPRSPPGMPGQPRPTDGGVGLVRSGRAEPCSAQSVPLSKYSIRLGFIHAWRGSTDRGSVRQS
ncbi:hypothetical protein G6F40_016474 [Rhizopus arrhizus]|nr:hypothetical protein G6F40_016474 [Rhizopus arrhizus]